MKKKRRREEEEEKNQDPSSVLFQTDAYPNSGRVAEINLITWLVSITVIVPPPPPPPVFNHLNKYRRPNFSGGSLIVTSFDRRVQHN